VREKAQGRCLQRPPRRWRTTPPCGPEAEATRGRARAWTARPELPREETIVKPRTMSPRS
jgi:hypothetical protein